MKHVALSLCLLVATSVAYAKRENGARDGGKMREELGLNDEQIAKMKEIRQKKKALHQASREKIKAARDEFKATMKDPKASKEQIIAKFEALQKLQSEKKRSQLDMMLEIRGLLNEEQIAKFQEKRKDWKKQRGQWGKRQGAKSDATAEDEE